MAKTIVIPALGRSFSLGMLYDMHSEEIIPSGGPWSKETIELLTHTERISRSELVCDVGDKYDQRIKQLAIDAPLKMSVLAGLVNLEGAATYLEGDATSNFQERVTITAKYVTSFKRMVDPKIESPELLSRKNGTHYVAGIKYGANVVFVFDKTSIGQTQKQLVKGEMNALEKRFHDVQAGVNGGMAEHAEDALSGFSCRFFGDVQLLQNPVNLKEALIVYRDLPTLVGGGVPILIYLEPIQSLTSGWRRGNTSTEIGINTENLVSNFFEDLRALKFDCDNLCRSPGCNRFPMLSKDIQECADLVEGLKLGLQQKLKVLLPQIRRKEADSSRIAKLLGMYNSSPLAYKHLKAFLEAKRVQVESLNLVCEYIPVDVKIVSEQKAHFEIDNSHQFEYVLHLKVSTAADGGYISCCRGYLNNGKVIAEKDLQENLKNERAEIPRCGLASEAIAFSNHYEANCNAREQSKCKYIVSESSATEKKVTTTLEMYQKQQAYSYSYLKLIHSRFVFVGKPGPCQKQTSGLQEFITWDAASSGSERIRCYELEFTPKHMTARKSILRTTDDTTHLRTLNLRLCTTYRVRCRACTDLGVGGWSDESEITVTHVYFLLALLIGIAFSFLISFAASKNK